MSEFARKLPNDTLTAALTPSARARSAAALAYLAQHLSEPEAWLRFDEFMALALTHPEFGYYTAGEPPFGALPTTSDFTTAPESTPLFAWTLARQIAQIFDRTGSARILEVGAGSGRLAHDLLSVLPMLGCPAATYQIVEISPALRARQQQLLSPWQSQVSWCDTLPTRIEGCVIANELLDALPVRRFQRDALGRIDELGVAWRQGQLVWATRPASAAFAQRAASCLEFAGVPQGLPYTSEIGLAAQAWVAELAARLHNGVALLIDYGFPMREFYHPQRVEGTLMCHLRHQAHDNALFAPGAQDLTAHIDFSAIANAATAAGAQVLGYTSQARFLINAGLDQACHDLLNAEAFDALARQRALGGAQRLVSEAEMGELFKVIAIGKGERVPAHHASDWLGFQVRDRRDSL